MQGEPFTETKKRIQLRIGASDKEISRYKFALIHSTQFKAPSPIEECESGFVPRLLGDND